LLAAGVDPWLAVLVAERSADGMLVGSAVAFRSYNTEIAETAAYLDHLYVVPEARGHGVGAALMGVVCRRARDWGCTKLRIYVLAKNLRAQRFYKAQGAREEPSSPVARRLIITLLCRARVAGWLGLTHCLQIDLTLTPSGRPVGSGGVR
jgi:GNAT superfamily N-acetyltransferase